MRRLAIAAWLLAGAAVAAPLSSVPLSRADQPWWRARLAQKAAELRSSPVDLVWYGDSITQDFERASPQPWNNFAPVWQYYYGGRHAINLGFMGDTTSHLLWRIENGEAKGIHPKAVVVLIGANNFGKLRWPAPDTELGVERIVAELHARLPSVRVLLIGVLPCIRGPWVDQNTAALNHALAARYRSGADATFVDLSSLFLRNGHIDGGKFVDSRLTPPWPPLHPNAMTQAAMAAAIEPALSRMLGDPPRPPMVQ